MHLDDIRSLPTGRSEPFQNKKNRPLFCENLTLFHVDLTGACRVVGAIECTPSASSDRNMSHPSIQTRKKSQSEGRSWVGLNIEAYGQLEHDVVHLGAGGLRFGFAIPQTRRPSRVAEGQSDEQLRLGTSILLGTVQKNGTSSPPHRALKQLACTDISGAQWLPPATRSRENYAADCHGYNCAFGLSLPANQFIEGLP
jgi:hypothetical protein